MLAGFLTNAAVASVASRFQSLRRFFEITEMIIIRRTRKL